MPRVAEYWPWLWQIQARRNMTLRSDRIEWDFTPTQLAENVLEYGKKVLQAIVALARIFAAKIEAWAKQNASWTDRTSNARQGLTCRALKTATGVIIVLFHTMEYGIWLETAHAGKYAIIMKALETHYSPLMLALQALVKD